MLEKVESLVTVKFKEIVKSRGEEMRRNKYPCGLSITFSCNNTY